jgi:diguanylate cyclase (GGDEF)-like protein
MPRTVASARQPVRANTHARPDRALLFLARLASEFTSVQPLPRLVERVMLALHEEAGLHSCCLALLDEQHPDTLTMLGASGLRASARGQIVPRQKGLYGAVMTSRMPLLVSDLWADPRVHRREAKIRSGIYAPLIVDGRAVGVLSAHSAEPRTFGESDLSLLTIVARYLTGAIEVVRLHAALKDSAAKDALTGLANRRNFLDRLAAEVARGQRRSETVGVVVLDLDGFGIINDVHGHAAGDALLVRVAQTLTEQIRRSDLIARLGSDEFGLVLPDTRHAQALKLLSRLQKAGIPVPRAGQATSPLSFSFGVAVWPKDAQTPESLLREAEVRVRAMKHRSGRGSPARGKAREVAHSGR